MINIAIEDMLAAVQKKVQDKVPVSVIRYGDGEAIILNGFKDEAKLVYVSKRQFGQMLPYDDLKQIQANLVEAYAGADIIGVPVNNRFMEDRNSYWYKAFGILDEAIGIDVLQNKLLTSIDFHIHWLQHKSFEELLTGRKHLCYISCRKLDQELKKRFSIENVWSYQIAPEMKFTSGYKGKKHFPDQFKEIRRWVTKVPVEDTICLVGAGVAGKIYCNWFRDLGGYAIDVGSVMDSWAGKVTRGQNRGLDAVDETYKL